MTLRVLYGGLGVERCRNHFSLGLIYLARLGKDIRVRYRYVPSGLVSGGNRGSSLYEYLIIVS